MTSFFLTCFPTCYLHLCMLPVFGKHPRKYSPSDEAICVHLLVASAMLVADVAQWIAMKRAQCKKPGIAVLFLPISVYHVGQIGSKFWWSQWICAWAKGSQASRITLAAPVLNGVEFLTLGYWSKLYITIDKKWGWVKTNSTMFFGCTSIYNQFLCSQG